jgi:Cu/Ag efflux protein CusF
LEALLWIFERLLSETNFLPQRLPEPKMRFIVGKNIFLNQRSIKIMKNRNLARRLMSLALAACMAASLSVSAFALENSESTDSTTSDATAASNNTSATGTSSSTDVKIKIEATELMANITVPTAMAFSFNADGSTTVPSNFTVKNYGLAGVYLKDVTMTGSDSWDLAGASEDVSKFAADTKKIALYIDDETVTSSNKSSATMLATSKVDLSEGTIGVAGKTATATDPTSTTIHFYVERGAFTSATTGYSTAASAYTMACTWAFTTQAAA